MKAISITDSLGLTKGKEYEVLEASAGYYKVILDNGNDLTDAAICLKPTRTQRGHNSKAKEFIIGLWGSNTHNP